MTTAVDPKEAQRERMAHAREVRAQRLAAEKAAAAQAAERNGDGEEVQRQEEDVQGVAQEAEAPAEAEASEGIIYQATGKVETQIRLVYMRAFVCLEESVPTGDWRDYTITRGHRDGIALSRRRVIKMGLKQGDEVEVTVRLVRRKGEEPAQERNNGQ